MTQLEISCATPWQDRSDELNELIRNAPEGSRLKFAPGEYYLRESLRLVGKRSLVLDAEGCVFTVTNNPACVEESAENMHAFVVEDCVDITFVGFECRQEWPANVGGEILDVQEDHIDVRLYRPLPEKAIFSSGMVFNPEGRPLGAWWFENRPKNGHRTVIANEVVMTSPACVDTPHEVLGNHCHRVYKIKPQGVKAGMHCTVKHWQYGPPAFVFRNSESVTLDTVTISNWGGFGVLILPRCRDFTIRRFTCRPHDRIVQPYSVLVDGVHTTGLGGRLLMEDCQFEGLGDDVLNSHTPTLKVVSSEGAQLSLVFDKPDALFPKRWGRAGDTLLVYDGETLAEKARVRVASVQGNGETLLLDAADAGKVSFGDYVVNMAYIPDEVILRHCTAFNCTSRIVIQAARRVEICGCRTKGVSLYFSSACRYWGEGGLVENVDIHDNEVRMLPALNGSGWNAPAVWMRVNDRKPGTTENIGKTPPRPRYRNLRSHGNVIEGRLDISNCDGVEIVNNRFLSLQEDTVTVQDNCTDVRIS